MTLLARSVDADAFTEINRNLHNFDDFFIFLL